MNTWLEKLALTLFLLLGMGFYSATHADSSLPEEKIECPISGQVSLRVNGTLQNGRLDGFINNQFVTLTIFNQNVTGFVNGHYINLRITPERNEYLLTGWISTNYIRWTSFGQQFREWVYCH